MPAATSVSASRNSADPTVGPAVGVELLDPAAVALYGVSHHRSDVSQASQVTCRIGDRSCRQGVSQWAKSRESVRHAACPVHTDKSRVTAFPRGRNQGVDRQRLIAPDYVELPAKDLSQLISIKSRAGRHA
jgi:hypothetical protein